MGLSPKYTKCTRCDLNKSVKSYFNTDIRPKQGLQESVLKNNYCENCETYTKWFMGEGNIHIPLSNNIDHFYSSITLDLFPQNYSESEFTSNLNEKVKKMLILELEIEKLSKSTLSKLTHLRKLNSVKKERKDLMQTIEHYKKNFNKSLENVESYKRLKSKPRCLECCHDKLYDKPKHSCGGDIYIETDKEFKMDPISKTLYNYEYDEHGNVTKSLSEYMIEWLNYSRTGNQD